MDGSTGSIQDLVEESSTNTSVSENSIKDNVNLDMMNKDGSAGTEVMKALRLSPGSTRGAKKMKRTVFTCDYPNCGKVFLSLYSLKAHDMSHTGERPHVCGWADCGRSFTSFYSMSAHCRTHTGQRPYSCTAPGCQKAFKSSSDLRRHSRTHTGDKPYACTFRGCFKSFSTSDIRKVHMRSHTGERPYVCDYENCQRTFKSQTNLANHRRVHTGEKPFQCKHPGCGKSFAEYSTLHKHQLVHTPRITYTCEMCKRVFRNITMYQAHQRRDHNWVNGEAAAQTPADDTAPSPSAAEESPQRIQLLLTDVDVRSLGIEGDTAQVLVLPSDGDQGEETDGPYDLHLVGCTSTLVVESEGNSPGLAVSPAEGGADDPELGEVGLSVVIEDTGT
ncbi:zinc finger protein 76-like isoform X3 [Amphibalanus amphitrite]|nr:zinc finger protein 76-like isoform X3 [Amphibalanus amphitrite]